MNRVVSLQSTLDSSASARLHGGNELKVAHRSALHVTRFSLAGCGVVGSALLRLLQQRAPQLEAEHGLRFDLQQVLVRDRTRTRDADLPSGAVTDDPHQFLHATADVLVEAIGGLDPAEALVRQALIAGRDVVSANKALIAVHGTGLAQLAQRHHARLDFEAAVGGGAPIIQTLRDSLAQTQVRSIRGILNGTSNFILTRMADGIEYAEALQQAQQAGFAEADPQRDLDGSDAADKIRILAWLAFGIDPQTLKVSSSGILPDPDELARQARNAGGVLRLIAECERIGDQISAWVRPVIVEPDSAWARTRNEENLIAIETRFNGTIHIAGLGAGGYPTASSLLADLVRGALWRKALQRAAA